MNDRAGGATTPREEVFKAIEHRNPSYVPGWLNFFAGETRDRYGEALAALSENHEDDVVVVVLSTFPPMAEMPPRPEGAEWAAPAKVIDRLYYRERYRSRRGILDFARDLNTELDLAQVDRPEVVRQGLVERSLPQQQALI